MTALPQLQLHHVGIAVADIEEQARTYIERFGYTACSAVIHDPRQTAYVQFLALPGQNVYVELVAPDGPESRLTNAIKRGGGLNHLCYATRDIVAMCDDLRAKGLTLIHPPVPAVAFHGRRIAWLMGRDRVLFELVERGPDNEL